MRIFDFNIHLPYVQHEDVNVVIEQDMSLDVSGIQNGFTVHKNEITKCIGANFLLFNTELFNLDVSPFFKSIKTIVSKAKYTALVDFRKPRIAEYIDNLKQCGIHAVMFNSYLQQIEASDFESVLNTCRCAAEKNLIICIDGSYGTSKMYTYDNMKLACYIADYITRTPIVIVHSGGYRLIEAMLLAADKKNVWLDTSFSLPYYIGSSVEMDFAYIIKKMKTERVVFGSDHPYIPFDEAVNQYLKFFDKYGFSDVQIDLIMCNNALTLFSE